MVRWEMNSIINAASRLPVIRPESKAKGRDHFLLAALSVVNKGF
jgi:hypothetical protein